MNLQQQKETLTVAIAEFQNYIENADHTQETNPDFICEDIVPINKNRDKYYNEQYQFIFDIISPLSVFENEILSEDDLDEILMELENSLEEIKEVETRNTKIGELYKGVFVYQNPLGIVNIINDNVLVNLCAFFEKEINFLAVRYENIWYKLNLKVANTEEGEIANYINSNKKVGIVDVIDYDSIVEDPNIEKVAIARVFLDSLENPDELGWEKLQGASNLNQSFIGELTK